MWLHDARLLAGVAVEQVTGQVFCRGRHNGQQLENVVGNVLLEQATLLNQPFRQLHSQLYINQAAPEVLAANRLAPDGGDDAI